MTNAQILKILHTIRTNLELLEGEELNYNPIQIELGSLLHSLKRFLVFVEINHIGNETEYIFKNGLELTGTLRANQTHCYYCAVERRKIVAANLEGDWYTCPECGYVWKV